jgi:hypothetical protein
MLVWGGYDGGYLGTGGRYDPTTDSWRSINVADAPEPRALHTAAWVGDGMVVWGGYQPSYLSTGAHYCANLPCFAPSGTPTLAVQGHPNSLLSWSALSGSSAYDVVAGSLTSLATSHGDFSVATSQCLANDTTMMQANDASVPVAGQGTWFLVRGVACAPGSYDEPAAGQQGSRDAEIAAAASSCP